MKARGSFLVPVLLIGTFLLQACGGGPAATEPAAEEAAAAPAEPVTQPEIVHSLIPSTGADKVSNAHDNEESTTFENKNVPNGDDFQVNRFERPFTATEMGYMPWIDIFDIGMTQDANFYYVQITLAGVDPATSGANGWYGAEFDLNIDGRGDVLLLAEKPKDSTWTTDGVRVYADENGDIGGETARQDAAYVGNGYETLVFDSGSGADPDLAWANFVNTAAPIVQIAFKREVLEDNPKFMYSVLASAWEPDAGRMYFNDTYSRERAGSPSKQDSYYPVQELWGFDNTCRLPAGFTATGAEPYGCQVSGPAGGEKFKSGGPWQICIPCLFDLDLIQLLN
jgi:hypothetical protein